MKKFLLLLTMVLTTVGAWAAVSKPATGVYVISGDIEGGRRGRMAAVEGITEHPALSNITWSNYASNSATPIENGEHWYVYQVGDKYVIYNLGLEKFLVNPKNGNQINFGDDPYLWDILVNSSNNNFNSIWDATGTYLCFACGTNAAGRNVRFNNEVGDGGSLHTFTAVEDGETTYKTQIDEVKNIVGITEEEITYTLTDVNGATYTGTYSGRPQHSTPQISGATISNYVWNGTTVTADVTFDIPVSSGTTKNQVTIAPFSNISNTAYKYYVSGSDVKVTRSGTVTNHLWEIYPSFENGEFSFQIKNVATGKYIFTALESNTNPVQGNVTVVESEGTYFTLESSNQFKVKGKSVYLSTHSSTTADQWATVWTTHNGTKNKITIVNTIADVNYILTDIAGNTYTYSVEGTTPGIDPVFTGVEGYTLDGSWNGNNYSATITFPFPVSSATQANPTLIGQGTWNNADKKWTVVDGNVKVVNGTATLGTSQWLIYPQLDGTQFTFKIKSASTGKYVTANLESGADAEATNTPITLTENGTGFQFINTGIDGTNGFAYTNNGGTTLYITRNGEGDNNELLGVFGSSTGHKGNGIRFPEFNQFKVVIGEVGYATVYAPFTVLTNDENYNSENLANNNLVEIYTVAGGAANGEKLTLTPMSNCIFENSGAILKGKGTYVFSKTDNEYIGDYGVENEPTKWEANLLKGSSVNTYVSEDAYVLSAPNGVESVGLYLADKNFTEEGVKVGKGEGTRFLNNAGKAYLPASAVANSNVKAFFFNFDGETTAIETVETENANAPIYDLSGRRVLSTVKGGIYIQNGKKFIVK